MGLRNCRVNYINNRNLYFISEEPTQTFCERFPEVFAQSSGPSTPLSAEEHGRDRVQDDDRMLAFLAPRSPLALSLPKSSSLWKWPPFVRPPSRSKNCLLAGNDLPQLSASCGGVRQQSLFRQTQGAAITAPRASKRSNLVIFLPPLWPTHPDLFFQLPC